MSYQKEDSGDLVGHYHCPECGSSDNLAIYMKTNEDGGVEYNGHCFTPNCIPYWSNNQLVELNVISGDFIPDLSKIKPPRKRITKQEYEALISNTNTSGRMLDGSQYRGLSDWVLGFYGHRVERNPNGRINSVRYPETKDGKVMGYKSRHLPKRFGIGNIGKTGMDNDLSGQHKFPSGGKYVVVVAGEEDKCAAQDMFRIYQRSKGQDDYDPIAVVSPTTGEGGAAKQCMSQYAFLDMFENIIICMDNDKAGKEASDAIVKVLPKDKVKVMLLSGKDVNQMLLDGKQKQFISNFFEAKGVTDTGIKSSLDAKGDVVEFLTAPKIGLPSFLHKLEDAMRGGIRSTGALVNIIGDTSIGKTLFTDNLLLHWIYESPVVPTIISLERTAGELLTDMYSLHIEKNLVWFENGEDAVSYLERPDIKALCEDLLVNNLGEPRFHIIDERDGSVEGLKRHVDRVMKQHGSKLFVFDPTSDFVRSLPLSEQEDFYMWQKQLKKNGAIIVNVLHTRKSGFGESVNKDGSFRKSTEYDALGTSSSVQSADINIVLSRNKMATDGEDRNTTIVDMPKCRGGVTGTICELYYDHETRQQYDLQDWLKIKHGKTNDDVVLDVKPIKPLDYENVDKTSNICNDTTNQEVSVMEVSF